MDTKMVSKYNISHILILHGRGTYNSLDDEMDKNIS